MKNWQDVWQRLREGRHVVLRGVVSIPAPDPAALRLSWVDCEAYAEPRGALDEARRRIDQLVGGHPVVDAASRRLRAGLRRHLLGEDREVVEIADYEDAFGRGVEEGPPAAVHLYGVDRADAESLELLGRLITGERSPKWPLLISFDEREPEGAARRLLQQLERVLPPEAFWKDEQGPASSEPRPAGEALSALSAESLRVLRAGATIGDRFEASVLAALLDRDELEVLDVLQSAVDAGVPLDDRGQGVFRLAPAAAQALRERTLPSLACAWHERLSALFGGLPAPPRGARPGSGAGASPAAVDQLARLFAASALAESEATEEAPSARRPEQQRAADASAALPASAVASRPVAAPGAGAAASPSSRGSSEGPPTQREADAGEWLHVSPSAPPHAGDPRTEPWWQRLQSEVARAGSERPPAGDGGVGDGGAGSGAPGDRPRAAELRAAAHAEAAGLWGTACAQHLAAAERASHLDLPARALDYAERALALVEQIADPRLRRLTRVRALLVVGRSRWRSSEPGESSLALALEPLSGARGLLQDDDPPELRAELASLIANVCYDVGTPQALERALMELSYASQALLDAGKPLDAARLLNDEAAVWVKVGDPVRANHLLSRSREVFVKVADSYPAARAELLETEHLLARLMLHATPRPGRERDALQLGIEHARAAEEGYRDLNDARQHGRVLETLGRLELRAGHLPQAMECLEHAQRLQRQTGDAMGLARSSGALSEAFARARDYPRALDRLAESIAFNGEKGSGAGLRFNLESLRQLEAELPDDLRATARELERRLAVALGLS